MLHWSVANLSVSSQMHWCEGMGWKWDFIKFFQAWSEQKVDWRHTAMKKKGSNKWRKEAKNCLTGMKRCRGLVCRERFCRGLHLCINWENKNLCIEPHAQLSERFKSCSDNRWSKSTSRLKRAQVTTRLSQLTYLVHLTVSQWRDHRADGSTAWYITLGPVSSEQNQMFCRVQNILQTPGCCRPANATIPWTEIYLHQRGLAEIPESSTAMFL